MLPDSSTPAPPVAADAVWVVDPHSGKQVNIGPFLRALHISEPDQPLASGAQAAVQHVLRFVGGLVYNFQTINPAELADIHDELWQLWDLFEQTKGRVNKAHE